MLATAHVTKRDAPTGAAEEFKVSIGNTATIGRSPANTIVLPGCPKVSREHAVLRDHGEDKYYLMDLGSANGTFLDGKRVALPVAVKDGSIVEIGSYQVRFNVSAADPNHPGQVPTFPRETQRTKRSQAEVALLVCDLVGFSRASESVPAYLIARTLGKWFRSAGRVIRQHGGSVDRFLGDGFIACWPEGGQHAAANTALDSVASLTHLATGFRWPDESPFRLRFALHYGAVLIENVGSVPMRDATIIGDAVNTVCKLEAWMKNTEASCVCTEMFASHLLASKASLNRIESLVLSGKQTRTDLYSVEPPPLLPETRS